MDDETMLPEDDRDLHLARRLGAALAAGRPLDAPHAGAPDRLVTVLLDYRSRHEAGAELSGEVSDRLWRGVEARLRPPRPTPEARRDRLARPRSRRVPAWAHAAAAVVVLAALTWLLLFRAPAPVVVASADAEIVAYTTPDGSTVTLRPRSVLYRVAVSEAEMRYRLAGEAFFDVVRDAGRVFAVEAGQALVTVLGTRFDVRTWGDGTAVYLEEGAVRMIHAPTEAAVVLAPGQRVSADETGLGAPAPATPDEELDWLRRELRFEQRPLRDVLAELSHHYGLRLEAPDTLLAQTLTGQVALDGLAEALADLGVVLGGRFVETGEDTYQFAGE